MPLLIPRYRYTLAVVTIASGTFLSQAVTLFWPALFDNVRFAIVLTSIAFALKALFGDVQGRMRTLCRLTVGITLLAASLLALTDPIQAASALIDTAKAWHTAGFSVITSFRAIGTAFAQWPEPQQQALATSLITGLLILIIMFMPMLPKLAPNRGERISKHGPWRARWMNSLEFLQLQHNEIGLPLGLHKGAMLRYKPNPKSGWRSGHHAAIAGTRAGKGVSVVIPAIIDHDGPVAVLDIKGENFAVTRRYRQSLGRQVLVLNPFGVIEAARDRFNPLDYIRPSHMV